MRERLRDLNFKDYGYVLITNKLPPRYRGTPNLAFLQNIPWLAVFDLFDSASKKDGLYYVCNETTDLHQEQNSEASMILKKFHLIGYLAKTSTSQQEEQPGSWAMRKCRKEAG